MWCIKTSKKADEDNAPASKYNLCVQPGFSFFELKSSENIYKSHDANFHRLATGKRKEVLILTEAEFIGRKSGVLKAVSDSGIALVRNVER